MSPRRDGEGAVLTSEEAALIRRALIACSQILAWAGQHGDPDFRQMLAQATLAAEGNRSPGGLAYYVSLAIDYLDFARAPRSRT